MPKNENAKPFDLKHEIFEWVVAIVIALAAAFIIKTFLFTFVTVEGPSMESTLHTGDRLFVTRLNYVPKTGDIVVFHPKQYNESTNNDKPFVKRVIATAGQTVYIDKSNGAVYIDDVQLNEPYLHVSTGFVGDVDFPVTVPDGCIFVLGDNRGNSHDSRSSDIGMIDIRDCLGKAQFRIWPVTQIGGLY